MANIDATLRDGWQHYFGKIDRVLLTIIGLIAGMAVYSTAMAIDMVTFAFGNLVETAPFLILSIVIAAYATATGADGLIGKVFAGRTATMVLVAALFGALSPFCSCGVIPIIAALLTMGVPLAPVMAFWLASPIMDPSMFVMTIGTIGLDYAVGKTIAAVTLGALGGFGIMWLARMGVFTSPLRDGIGDGGCGASSVRDPKPVQWAFWRDNARITKFRNTLLSSGGFLVKWLVLAFMLEFLMLTFVPAEWIASALGGTGIVPIGIATVVGVPAYLNGFAALPLMSGLLQQGMAPGAALSFMVAGGVTCIPAAIAVFALVKRPVFYAYIGFALSGSFLAGVVFQMVSVGF